MADISSGSNLRKPAVEGPVEGARSIVGFGLASQTGFMSETGASTASSFGELDISWMSPLGTVVRGRVWANTDVDVTERAKQATMRRGNSFRSSINRGIPFSTVSKFLLLLREEGTAKDIGILAAEIGP